MVGMRWRRRWDRNAEDSARPIRNHLAVIKGADIAADAGLRPRRVTCRRHRPTPAVATAEPFIVAELDPVDTKDIRVRGRLIEANVDEMYYTVALRPFFDARTILAA